MSWLADHWELALALFYLAEKVVKESKAKWDDILIDGAKHVYQCIVNPNRRP